jgi:hypothetical protein
VRHGWQAELGREAVVAWDGVRLDGRLARPCAHLRGRLRQRSLPPAPAQGLKRHPGLLPHRLSFDLCQLGASHRGVAVRAAGQRRTQARLHRRRGRAAAGTEWEPPAYAFESRDRRGGQGAAVRACIRMANGSGLRGAVQADSGECARQQARHPLVDVGTASGHPCCDRSGLRALPSRGQENASGANAARLGTAERGAIQSAEVR